MSWLEPGEEVQMQREQVTPALIKRIYRRKIVNNAVALFVFTVVCGLFVWWVSTLNDSKWLLMALIVISYVMFLSASLYALYSPVKLFQGDYRVEYTTLERKSDKPITNILLQNKRGFYYYGLYFHRYGEYLISRPGKWNTFSKYYRMTTDEFYRSCREGNPFFLLVDRKNRILLAFNEQHFEWTEDVI